VSVAPGSKKMRVVVTAGPTREKIDPVRFISNYSTGTFGYEIAREAKRRGCDVVLVSGPSALVRPSGVKFISVESAGDMLKAVGRESAGADCVIMAAAVSDWRVGTISKRKIKKGTGPKFLRLVPNTDILKKLGEHKAGRMLVGFALETEDLVRNAARKLKEKHLDLVIANRLGGSAGIFGGSKTDITIIDRHGTAASYRGRTKRELAGIILDRVFCSGI
jgi:phosphopantothenoylcysteine decarboxylase / phosphopantothenate---cysteine ligase